MRVRTIENVVAVEAPRVVVIADHTVDGRRSLCFITRENFCAPENRRCLLFASEEKIFRPSSLSLIRALYTCCRRIYYLIRKF
jgi:hypothetical protein